MGDQKEYFKFKVGERKVRHALARPTSWTHTARASKAQVQAAQQCISGFCWGSYMCDAVACVSQTSECIAPSPGMTCMADWLQHFQSRKIAGCACVLEAV